MEWCRLAVKYLIETYKEETCLYNIKSPNYNNHARKEALERIAAVFYCRRTVVQNSNLGEQNSITAKPLDRF